MNGKKDSAKNTRPPAWFWLAFVALLLLPQFLLLTMGTGQIPYSQFKHLLNAGNVEQVQIADDVITGTLKPEGLERHLTPKELDTLKHVAGNRREFSTQKVQDPSLVSELERAGVTFTGEPKNTWLSTVLWLVVPFLLYLWFLRFLMKGKGLTGWALDIGKSKARVYMENETGVTFKDVAGIDEAKEELMEVVEFLKRPEQYRRLGGKIPKGVLIVGAPGTGKTLLAKAVAGEAGVPFFSISGSEFVEMFVGVGAARVRDLFAQAEQKAPCIIFIDELDAIGKARGASVLGSDEEHGQTLNQLLVEMDGFNSNKGVIILAATNRPEILDPALLRPGRFDRHIAIDRPDLKGRAQILAVHTRNVALSPEVDLSEIAARTPGFAGADLANAVNEAALLAARRGKDKVEMVDFDDAIDRIVAGLERKNRVMNAQEKETVAYHESGHALVAESRRYAERVSKVSIIPRGVAALGYTQQVPTEDRYLLKRAELFDRLDVYLGGRVAEEIVFGDVSTGAQNDLQLATDMARHMVTQYGMSERLGLVTYEEAHAPLLHPSAQAQRNSYSERSAEVIDAEVARLLDEAHRRVRETLLAKRGLLDLLAHTLLQKETVDRAGFDEILRSSPGSGRYRQA